MTSPVPTLRLGTRRSPLAMAQATAARDALVAAAPDVQVELVPIVSDGDRDDRPFAEIGTRGIFASTLERALRDDEIDLAVHSTKDLPLADDEAFAGDLELVAFPERADARDALVLVDGTAPAAIGELPDGAAIATSSARRTSAIATLRADLTCTGVRGNVATRIERSGVRGDAACMLAAAGLARLAAAGDDVIDGRAVLVLDPDQCVPEAGQGAVVWQARSRADLQERFGIDLGAIEHAATRRTVLAERAVAARLAGGCERPVGVHVDLPLRRAWLFAAPEAGAAGSVEVVDLGIELAASEADPDGVVLAASLEPAVSRLAAAMPRQEARS